jgi:hypothetical protein
MREASSHKSFDFNSGIPKIGKKALVVPTYPLAPIQHS